MATKGLQKIEIIENLCSLGNVKRRGGLIFLNIRPVEKRLTGFNLIFVSFLFSKYVNFFRVILIF